MGNNKLLAWHDLVARIADVILNGQIDSIRCLTTKNGQFTLPSMYNNLIDDMLRLYITWFFGGSNYRKRLRFFIWLLSKGIN